MTQKQSNYYFIRGYMEKKAQHAYDAYASDFAPNAIASNLRDLTDKERQVLHDSSKKLFPKYIINEKTKLTDTMSSPVKGAIMAAIAPPLVGAAFGAAAGGLYSGKDGAKMLSIRSAIRMLKYSPFTASMSYYIRRGQNNKVRNILRSLPINANNGA